MKKHIAILILGLLLATSAQAQIYVMENEGNQRDPIENVDAYDWPNNPLGNGEGHDNYTPLGDGLLLLAALGGAYLIRKRNKE